MAEPRPDGGSSNTATVAIVVLILVAVVAFLVFFWNGGEAEPPTDGPDVELQVEPPTENGGSLDEGAGADDEDGEDPGVESP